MKKTGDKKRALIVCVSKYADRNLENLDFCENDGEEMYKVLTKLGYEIPQKRKLVGTIDDSTIKQSLVEFFRDESVNTTDTLLFYFSGHGTLDGYQGRFFATSNIDTKFPEVLGIPFNLLTQQMKRSPARKTIAILDCCFSGGAEVSVVGKSGMEAEEEAEKLGREALNKVFSETKGTCILASSLSNRRSFNMPGKNMSAFSYFVVEGLKENKETVDENGFVTPDKLDEFVYSKLKSLDGPTQEPVRNISISGKMVLAHYPSLASKKKMSEDKLKKLLMVLLKKNESKKFNELKRKYPKISQNLTFSNANLKNSNLEGVDLSELNFKGANFEGSNLRGAILEDTNLRNVNFTSANLSEANLEGNNLRGANLQNANLENANLDGTNLKGVILKNANLKKANLDGGNLEDTILDNANLEGANLDGANLERASLKNANMRNVDLEGANLEETDLNGANLKNANMHGAYLENTKLQNTNLEGANLKDTILENKTKK